MAHDNPSREAILGRVRSALKTEAPRSEVVSSQESLFPPVGEPIERLRTELATNLVESIVTEGAASSMQAIAAAILSLPGGEVFAQDSPELRKLIAVSASHSIRWSSEGPPAESSQATVSKAEMVVASTGSIVVSSTCGGRGASIVAPCHIVYAKTAQIVPDLDAAMDQIYKTGMLRYSFIGFITGASRTGDIEKILVHGAHGPRRVILVLEDDVSLG